MAIFHFITYRKFNCFIFFLLWLLPNVILAQENMLSGSVKNEANENLTFANITLVNASSTIIAYVISDEKGRFQLTIPMNVSSELWLEVSYLGYKKQRKPIVANKKKYHFVLSVDATALDEIVVKNRPVLNRMGDTLRYRVSSFNEDSDRSIGDVLKRMPGISVTDDGAIFYNGERISNLYIHGDDLMSGRYGLATKAINKEDIVAVDIIRNHQPIEVLKDKIFSDKTAINLILKDPDNMQLATKAMVGGGLPEQYDFSITPILLSKKLKMLNILAFNNSGVDYRDNFKQLGGVNYTENMDGANADYSLSLGAVSSPDLPISTYYINQSGLIDLNNLYNTKSGWQLKMNIQGFIDKNELNYSSRSENYTATDTIVYNERQKLVRKPQLLYTSFNIMANKPHFFLNNNLQINFIKADNSAFMHFNDQSFPQFFEKDTYEISNDFNWMPEIGGKGIGEVRWRLEYQNNKQQLRLEDGYYAEIPTQEGYYDQVLQKLHLPTLFSNAYISYKIPNTIFTQKYKLGYLAERQMLKSALNFRENQQYSAYVGDLGNDLTWCKNKLYFSADYQLKYKNFQSRIALPISYQSIRFFQEEYSLNKKNKAVFFNPSIDVLYNINLEQRVSANYSHATHFGSIADVFRGAILQNYRLLQSNHADIQKKTENTYGIKYSFEKSINLFFANIGLTYNSLSANTILASDFTNNIHKTYLLPYENTQESLRLNLGFSKYVFALNSTFSLNSQIGTSTFEQVINDVLVPSQSNSVSLNFTFNKKLFKIIRMTYKPAGFWNKSELDMPNSVNNNLTYNSFRLNQKLIINFAPVELWEVEIEAKHSFSKQAENKVQYFFGDINIRRNFKNSGIDLSLDVINLFNVKEYQLHTFPANGIVTSNYKLRGRMILLRLNWYF